MSLRNCLRGTVWVALHFWIHGSNEDVTIPSSFSSSPDVCKRMSVLMQFIQDVRPFFTFFFAFCKFSFHKHNAELKWLKFSCWSESSGSLYTRSHFSTISSLGAVPNPTWGKCYQHERMKTNSLKHWQFWTKDIILYTFILIPLRYRIMLYSHPSVWLNLWKFDSMHWMHQTITMQLHGSK
jgi:hypothetical protein